MIVDSMSLLLIVKPNKVRILTKQMHYSLLLLLLLFNDQSGFQLLVSVLSNNKLKDINQAKACKGQPELTYLDGLWMHEDAINNGIEIRCNNPFGVRLNLILVDYSNQNENKRSKSFGV